MSETKATKITLILGGARSGKSNLAEKLAYQRAKTENGVLYLATLVPSDNEMVQRVGQHRAARPATWRTLERPYELAQPVSEYLQQEQIVLLDCLTVWASNWLIREEGSLADLMSDPLPDQTASTPKPLANLSSPLEPDREETITSDLQVDFPGASASRQPKQFDYAALETTLLEELEHLIAGLRQRGIGLILVSNEVGMGLVPPYPLGRLYRDLLGRINQYVARMADEVFMVIAGIPVDLKQLQAKFE